MYNAQRMLKLDGYLSLVFEWKRTVGLCGHGFPASSFWIPAHCLSYFTVFFPLFVDMRGSRSVVLCTKARSQDFVKRDYIVGGIVCRLIIIAHIVHGHGCGWPAPSQCLGIL